MLELDPDVAAYLGGHAKVWTPMNEVGVDVARAAMAQMPRQTGPEMHAVADHVIDGPHGPLPVRVFRPIDAPVLPALVFMHGGGMVVGSVDSYDGFTRMLAEATSAVVVSVDFRLAPEHKYPVASDETYAAVQWLGANAAELGVDPARIAVAGDSAGAALAAGAALQTREEGGVPLAFQLLVYAGLDRDTSWPSVSEFADGPVITKADFAWTKNLYLGEDASLDHPYGVPSLAEDLAGLPSAIVVTASHDPSRDGAEDYGHRLRDAGVQTAIMRYPGVAHGFLMRANEQKRAKLALAEIAGLVKAKFAQS